MSPGIPENHYLEVVTAMSRGKLVPFLGAGVNNAAARAAGERVEAATSSLPDARGLARYIAQRHRVPGPTQRSSDLERVSQYVYQQLGYQPLYYDLHELFDEDHSPTAVHEFLASVPVTLRQKGYELAHPLIVTTNYDDLMEAALERAGTPADVVYYVAEGPWRGRFAHRPPGKEPELVERPNEYGKLNLAERPVVLKVHGAVERRREAKERDEDTTESYVVTEDHYINYLAQAELTSLVPQPLPAILKNRPFLFLGYSLRDWNMRVILHRIWHEDPYKFTSWAVQRHPEEVDRDFWIKRNLVILDTDLLEYIEQLRRCLTDFPPKQRAASA
jgi:hypothetical protein